MSMKFPNFSFPNKKVKPEFQNPSKFGQKGSHQICKAIDGQMRGKGHPAPLFGGIRPHPQPLKAALIHQQLFCPLLTLSLNFRQLPFFAQVFESVSKDVNEAYATR